MRTRANFVNDLILSCWPCYFVVSLSDILCSTDVYNHSVRNRCTSPLDPGARPIAQDQDEVIINFDKLSWVLDPQLRDAVDRSAIIFDKFIQRTQTVTLHFTGYGKRFIVNHRMSPDALLQMSYQLAYFRHTGKPAVSTYVEGET